MMRSMYSGVSGLRVHQTKMDVIGNNIANVNTIGFKSQRVNFNEVFSQTLQSSTGASEETGRGGRNAMQVGLGVNVSSIDTLMTQGAAQRTDNPFDLMIDGEGFIIVGDNSGKFFTRAGALRQDDDGNLVIPNGMKVQGWTTVGLDENGNEKIIPGEVGPITLGDPNNKTSKPEATTETRLSGNLDKNQSPISTQIKMYDSLGNLYSTPMELKYVDQEKNPDYDPADPAKGPEYLPLKEPYWEMKPKTQGVTIPPATTATEMMILTDTEGNEFAVENVFNNKPKLDGAGNQEVDGEGNPIFESQPVKLNFKPDGTLDIAKDPDTGKSYINFDQIKMQNAVATDGTPKPLNAFIGATDTGVQVEISNITQFASKTTIEPKTIDGKTAGTIMGFDVAGDGKITAYYDNGSTKLLGQICLAQFENPAGLEKVGDNLFKATANSGDFDNIGKTGSFQAGVLEMSNVDLSREFTDMITTQRGFQANSRIISVSDEMLQELVNLKR